MTSLFHTQLAWSVDYVSKQLHFSPGWVDSLSRFHLAYVNRDLGVRDTSRSSPLCGRGRNGKISSLRHCGSHDSASRGRDLLQFGISGQRGAERSASQNLPHPPSTSKLTQVESILRLALDSDAYVVLVVCSTGPVFSTGFSAYSPRSLDREWKPNPQLKVLVQTTMMMSIYV